ncbi:MAG: T9SS type A sorting domain-containing protein [Bacteroidota bacterium]|nr:T9SS type A sorting domain-containing protein [Bacteroidota bacterium]
MKINITKQPIKLLFCIITVWLMSSPRLEAQSTKIVWDYNSSKFVTSGVYARVKKLNTGELTMVYSNGPDVFIRKSSDEGSSWGNAITVAHTDGYNNTNSEMIQLTNGWLLYGWNGRPITQGGSLHFTICTKISKDNGISWANEQVVYSGDVWGANGVWEPSFIQIPSGEVQLYFANEFPYTRTSEQEISLMRSSDNGLTWGNAKQISFRAGSRDGMPVPVLLQNNKGIAMAIEDPGLNGTFKPVIIWTSTTDNWNQASADGSSPRRWHTVLLPNDVYAGAPYLIQLPSGETVLSFQSTEGRASNADNVSIMQVYVGNENAQNFTNKSTPFPNIPANGNAMWNSLTVINDSTIMAVSSVNTGGTSQNGIWTVKGKIVHASPGSQSWAMKQAKLMTSFSSKIDTGKVLPEYPRPQMTRNNWMNLNGIWQFQPGGSLDNFPTGTLSSKILVPFPVESAISGVMESYDRLWYKRTFTIPGNWNESRILLHFGAVDYEAEVFINGQSLGVHQGGYDPFSFDITPKLSGTGPQEVVVRVYDPTDFGGQPRGKQTINPGGIMYTSTTGIWQTVWLEPVPQTAIAELKMVPNIDNSTLNLTVTAQGTATGLSIAAKVRDGANIIQSATGAANTQFPISISNPKLWSPDSPFLYDMRVFLLKDGIAIDSVDTYFGMRKIALGRVDGYPKMILNNKFTFQLGPLDQGFWPDGNYTAPTDSALKFDLLKIKELGFNMVRKHIKVEPYRWYYWADKLGIMVWQDMPSPNSYTSINPPAIDEAEFHSELMTMVKKHWNSPCIVTWVIFNEGQGEHNAPTLVNEVSTLDPSRLVNESSGWEHQGSGNILDTHSYPPPACPSSTTQALACGEFGGIGYVIPGHIWKEAPTYVMVDSKDKFMTMYDNFTTDLTNFKTNNGLSAAVYTEITDVESELNGLTTYDRAVIKPDIDKLKASNTKAINQNLFLTDVLPTSETQGHIWKYTTNAQDASSPDWNSITFSNNNWIWGTGGFGTQGTPGSVIRTIWNTSDIWMRQTFSLGNLSPEARDSLILRVHHDENCEIYINGILATSLDGYTTSYTLVPLSQDAKNLFKANSENVIAVHCHQTAGGQYIDVGISLLSFQSRKYVGVSTVKGAKALEIFPNPTTDTIQIKGFNNRAFSAHVVNLSGVDQNCHTHSNGEINVSNLKPGVYLIQAKASGETFCSQFVKL